MRTRGTFRQGQSGQHTHAAPAQTLPLRNLNALRISVVLAIGFGYLSTLPVGPGHAEAGRFVGYDPSWFGLHVLFFLSGLLAWRSLQQGRTGLTYLRSRAKRTLPLLALYTLAAVSVLYPALCEPGSLSGAKAVSLLAYTVKTVTLVDPGGPIPGALNAAPYMCLLQGTVWTLRWGAALHLATVLAFALGVRGKATLLWAAVLTVTAYGAAVAVYVSGHAPWVEAIGPGLRFGYCWALGAALYAWRHRLPRTTGAWTTGALIFIGLAGAHYEFADWSPLIDVLATLGLCCAAMAVLFAPARLLRDWPALALPLYLGIWPIGQTVLATLPVRAGLSFVVLGLSLSALLAYAVVRVSSGVLSPPDASQLKRPRTA